MGVLNIPEVKVDIVYNTIVIDSCLWDAPAKIKINK
jgi:hypothetical protein